MTARRWTGLAAALGAAIALIVVMWPGGAGSAPVQRFVTQPPMLCSGSQHASCGRLIVRSRYVGGLPIEGALVSLALTRDRTRLVLQRMMGGVGRRVVRLPAGSFTLYSALHICDANCGHLDPPVRCAAAPLRIRARHTTRATIVLEVARCHVTVSG